MAKTESVEKVLRDHLRVKLDELERVKSEVTSVRMAIKAINGSSSPARASSNGHRTVSCRGLTAKMVDYLKTNGPKTPQELHKIFQAKDFESLKSCLSAAYRAGKMTRSTNNKGFFEYNADID